MKRVIEIVTFIMCFLVFNTYASEKDYIPPQAFGFKDTIRKELDEYFPEIPNRYYIPGLIEHESCISLKHKRCWNSMSELKSARERGVGLGQITVAYNSDGSVRFDSLYDLRTKYKAALKEASWDTIPTRPDIQIRMIILMTKENYDRLYDVDDDFQRLSMTDASYNGGPGGVQKGRRLCGLTKGCNPNVWFGNVEKMVVKSTKPIYGDRSPYDIYIHHVDDVLKNRMPKYQRAGYYN